MLKTYVYLVQVNVQFEDNNIIFKKSEKHKSPIKRRIFFLNILIYPPRSLPSLNCSQSRYYVLCDADFTR